MSFGTPAQQQLGQKFFAPFFRWPDDAALRAWLQEQSPDELEQFLGWFDLSNRRDRETLGRQELRKLRNPDTKIRALLSDGRALLSGRDPVNTHSEFERWTNKVGLWLEEDLGNPALSAIWSSLPYSPLVRAASYFDDEPAWHEFKSVVTQRLGWLGKVLPSSSSPQSETTMPSSSSKIFVVHGREEAPRHAVARFLDRLGFQPIILHEQPNQGRTIIEKIEAHSDVGFAVIILTPDDMGNLKGEEPRPRARQNVILELGYFIGKLTRKRVFTLTGADLEVPSDWQGVVAVPYDAAGGWEKKLAHELDAAEYNIDWNKVMRG